MDILFKIIGLIAAAFTSTAFLPQIIKGHKTKKMDDVSFIMLFVLIVGISCWIIYGIHLKDWIIILANTVGLSFIVLTLVMKLYYDRKEFK